MTSGGARPRSGPPPDPDALRRDRPSDAAGWVSLPAEGRVGPAPAWPLQLTNDREQDLWADLWSKPQAVEWERCGQEIQVALYVRKLTEAEEWGAAVARATLVNQMAGALGLTTPGLAANRWRIAPAEVPKAASAPRTSSKRRLTVVEAPNAVEGTKPAG